jgi:hypothetical protein
MATKEESRDLNEQNRLIIKGDHMVVTCTNRRSPGQAHCLLEAVGESRMWRAFSDDQVRVANGSVNAAGNRNLVQTGMRVRGGETIIGKIKIERATIPIRARLGPAPAPSSRKGLKKGVYLVPSFFTAMNILAGFIR